MKTFTKWLAAALFAATLPLAPAAAGTVAVAPSVPEAALPVVTVQSSCNAVGQQMAAQNGGTLHSATAQNQGGQTVCHIVVLVPAKDGQRPRRIESTVPL